MVPLVALAAVSVARGALAWAFESGGSLAAAGTVTTLRTRLLAHLVRARPGGIGALNAGDVAATTLDGADALEPYFARFLPQLVLGACVPPVLLVWVGLHDVPSVIVLLCTLPLIPVFGILIGRATERATMRRWHALSLLSAHFVDVVRGLPTLRAYRRGSAQKESIATYTDEYRRSTMATLRIAFLSAFALELAASLGTALVAAEIGIRLVDGRIGAAAGARDPRARTRAVCTSQGGLGPVPRERGRAGGGTAAARALGPRARRSPRRPCPPPRPTRLPARCGSTGSPSRTPAAAASSTMSRSRSGRASASPCSARAARASPRSWPPCSASSSRAAARSPSRASISGASTPTPGDCGSPGCRSGRCSSRGRSAQPSASARPDARDSEVAAALRTAGAESLAARLDDSVTSLSSGEQRRVALARALLREAPLLLLDEPTAHLDEGSAELVVATLGALPRTRTVVVATHDLRVLGAVDRALELRDGVLRTHGGIGAIA